MRPIGQGMWIGVDLFFVLSGFLISGLLFDDIKVRGKISIWRFYIRRGFKIYPPFYFFLFCSFLVDPAIRALPFWHEILFVQNYLPYVWGHTWSLAIEEHFYLALPLLLAALVRFHRVHWIPFLGLAISIACLLIRTIYCALGAWERVPFFTHTRIDSLFLGVVLGYFFHFQKQKFVGWTSNWILFVGVMLALPAFLLMNHPAVLFSVGLTANSCAFGCVLVWFVNRPSLRVRALETIGTHSYSIYLWHLPIVLVLRNEFRGSLVMFLATIGLCVMFGIVMAHIVEFPMLALRDRLTVAKPSASLLDASIDRSEAAAPVTN
jgi:peptidoglycan/LPS O-acetylase OafA/YrhL